MRSSWPSPTCRAPRTASTGRSRMFDKGYVSMATKVSEELTLKKARFALEQAQSKKKVLVDYTKDKTIKELESEVEKAHSDELAKKATWELEASKEKKLEKQIADCDDQGPQRRARRLRQRSQPGLRQQPAADRGRGDGARAAEDLQPARHHAGCRSTPRSTSRRSTRSSRSMKAKIRVDAFADRDARRHRDRCRAPARLDQLLQLGHQGLHDQGQDRPAAAGAASPA